MATINREPISKLHDKVTVKLRKEDYYPSFEKALKGYAKHANVPGFRKGMVPASMVKKMYGPALFQEEVFRSAGKQLEDYLTQESVSIFGQPLIMPSESPLYLDMNKAEDLDFSFEIGLKPEFEIPALDGQHKLTSYKIQVSDSTVEDEIKNISRRYGKTEPAEVVSHPEQILHVTVTPLDADGNAKEGFEPKEAGLLIERLPAKLQQMLMDKKVGDSIKMVPAEVCTEEELPAFMKAFLKEDIAHANETFELTVSKIELLIPRELDVMLFGEVFPNDNILDEAAFREKIKEELGREFGRQAESRLNDEIYEVLVHTTPIELPVAFLKRWMREGQEKPKTPSQVEHEFPAFDHQLRWTLISEKLIQENDIKVDRAEVINDMKGRVLAYFGMDNEEDAPWMEGYMEKMSKDEKTMNETYRQLLFGKLFNFLKTKFQLEEKVVDEKEFFNLSSAHEAHHHDH